MMLYVHCWFLNGPSLCVSDIPHFKQVVIMATTCNSCGYKSNEVKSGSGVSETGTRIKLKLTHISDLSRDIVQVCKPFHPSIKQAIDFDTFTTVTSIYNNYMYVCVCVSDCYISQTCTHAVLQSETSVLSIPSLSLECAPSIMGGRFTTVEGMLEEVKNQLERSNPFIGDSATNTKLKHFLEQLSEVYV